MSETLETLKTYEFVLKIKYSKILQSVHFRNEALMGVPSIPRVKVDRGIKKSAFLDLYFGKRFPKSIFSSHLNVPPRLRRYAPDIRVRKFLDEGCSRQQSELRGDPTFLLSR